jgi:hypothetical protein
VRLGEPGTDIGNVSVRALQTVTFSAFQISVFQLFSSPMKTFLAASVVFLVLLANHQNTLAGDQDFTLVNKTGVEIHSLHVSPADANKWGPDILGKDTLEDGQSVEIKFHEDEEAEKWDLRIEDKDGNAIEWEDLNLMKINKVILHYSNGKATAEVE